MNARQNTAVIKRTRQGMALLVCLFVVCIVSTLVVGVLDTCTIQYAAIRNTTDYEAAQYLAGAAVNHAIAELELDANWVTGIPSTEFPAGSGRTYSATVATGVSGQVVVTGTGVAGGTTRKLEVTVSLGG